MTRPLVKYAGYEDPKRAGLETRARTASRLFAEGMDTGDIANRFHCSEARVLQWLNETRSKRLGLPSPYEGWR